ncbi:hypothetical protein RRG08_054886 [Elysia crispata]|uniref:Uncharacterized protein n=1 Tax=Elysia crispata TaxID=231223 RepID=A0AAE1DSY2_9GAST|nr:hypothetical protein RRG08_054886 [Elysia crispata]
MSSRRVPHPVVSRSVLSGSRQAGATYSVIGRDECPTASLLPENVRGLRCVIDETQNLSHFRPRRAELDQYACVVGRP